MSRYTMLLPIVLALVLGLFARPVLAGEDAVPLVASDAAGLAAGVDLLVKMR